MSKFFENVFVSSVKEQEQAYNLMNKLVNVAKPESVFSEPVTAGDYTILTATEVSVGLGFGWGTGGGFDSQAAESEPDTEDTAGGLGSGGGGGGGSIARPVAAISIGPDGVTVEPIVDITKIALAFFTAFGAMWMMIGRMRQRL